MQNRNEYTSYINFIDKFNFTCSFSWTNVCELYTGLQHGFFYPKNIKRVVYFMKISKISLNHNICSLPRHNYEQYANGRKIRLYGICLFYYFKNFKFVLFFFFWFFSSCSQQTFSYNIPSCNNIYRTDTIHNDSTETDKRYENIITANIVVL